MTQAKDLNGKGHRFGGGWTDEKLAVLSDYLKAYATALKEKPSKDSPFRKVYIDAFAGTGYRSDPHEETASSQGNLFPELAKEEPCGLRDGSARIALKTDPPFEEYVFIERSPERCKMLVNLKDEFPALASRIQILQGEANVKIRDLCTADWRSRRAVLFLDPYGMQVEWQTIEAIARTQAIDLWILFPLGIGLNRLLTKSGNIPESWRHRLDVLLGTKDWFSHFYETGKHTQKTLLQSPDSPSSEAELFVKKNMDVFEQYFINRLKTIFAGVVEKPGILQNSTNNPLYLLCFAASNKRGAPIALRIANHLLKGLR
ncbi:MAG: three-Cys-motif partner protein TcmP [Planctomycetota bacterium]